MFKLYKIKNSMVTKGITTLGVSGLSTMIPMHVNAASGVSAEQLYITITGGAALAAIVVVATYAICSRDNKFDADCEEAVKLNGKFNKPPFKDETTSAKQYFKIVNRK